MIKSMTGFGKSICEITNKKITIEIRTLNSKLLDINTKIPNIYKEKYLEIRLQLAKKLIRGKIDLSIFIENIGGTINYSLNKALAKEYHKELKDLCSELGEEEFSNFLTVLIQMPEVIQPKKEEIDENEWFQIKSTIEKAIRQVDEFRLQEGKILEKDFVKRISIIEKLLVEIETFEKDRIVNLKKSIWKNLSELIDEKDKIDKNRFEQEIIYYLEKVDITEEKVRLKKHCDYFIETLNEPTSKGKKLNFICQEIGREINTLGSKANDAQIQKIVVQMKDELEKIKEQILNIL